MADPDEAQLSKLAKRILSMPHKKREESKIGRTKAKENVKSSKSVAATKKGKQ